MDQNSAHTNPVSSPVAPPSPPLSTQPNSSVVVSTPEFIQPVTPPNVVVAAVKPQNSAQIPSSALGNSNYVYASFFRRYFEAAIDNLILGTIGFFASLVIGFVLALVLGDGAQTIVMFISSFTGFAIGIFYYVFFIGSRGQTLGKMALGIKVIKLGAVDGHVGYTSAFLREIIGKTISALVFGLGYLWMLWDPQKQTWHDKISHTIVIKI